MEIIQSFAQFDTGIPQVRNNNKNLVYLNFYSFLLSYLTLNKFYGKIKMFCNEKAYETFVKFIPYDELVIRENNNESGFWNLYKLDNMRSIDDDVIHVDSDVFIFKDLFKPYIEGDYDMIIQDTISSNKNVVKSFFWDNRKFLTNGSFRFNPKYDGRCYSCGTFGLKRDKRDVYFKSVDVLKNAMDNGKVHNLHIKNMVIEELMAYLVAINKGFKTYEVLPHDLVLENGVHKVGNIVGYTHLWMKSKFEPQNILKIKNKIKSDFPDKYYLIEEYEENIKQKFRIRL